ncbi:Putative ribonuclease H protein At1g65750, partial [Linum perenne]
ELAEIGSCQVCPGQEESVLHVLRDCPLASATWELLALSSGDQTFFQTPLLPWIERFIRKPELCLLFGVTCWWLWRARNDRVFNNKLTTAESLTRHIQAWVALVGDTLERDRFISHTGPPTRTGEFFSWEPAPPEWVTLNSDGSVLPETGQAAAGGLIRDHQGRCLAAFTMNLGKCSITRAELRGAVSGLQLAWERGYRKIQLQLDSQCAVQLLQGDDLEDHTHAATIIMARELLRRDWETETSAAPTISSAFRADYSSANHRLLLSCERVVKGVKGLKESYKNMSESDALSLDEDKDNQELALHGLENAVVESKKRNRNLSRMTDNDLQIKIAERQYKRVLLSLGKPSYVLGLTLSSLRPESRIKLRTLLRKLVRLHDWRAASGVLSVLSRDPQKQSSADIYRFKYWVFLKLLQHMEGDYLSPTTIDSIFDAWMASIGVNVSHRRRTNSMLEDQFVLRLESILFHFMQGDVEEERQNVRRPHIVHLMLTMFPSFPSLTQEREFEDHPMFNMIIGLMFYQLWYSGISENMQLEHPNQMHHALPLDMEAEHTHSDVSASGFGCSAGDSEGNSVAFSETKSLRRGSDTSVMKNKEVLDGNGIDSHNENIKAEDGVKQFSKSYPEEFQPRGFYVDSADEASYDQADNVYSMPDLPTLGNLDLWLRPIHSDNCVGKIIQTDEYNNAVTHLLRAVTSTPPVLAALLPLVQLLLIKNDWKEALNVLDNFCINSSASLPHSLKSCILERIDPDNGDLLARCYEDALKSDPTCNQSLARLVTLHELGIYNSQRLLEMIATHLDASDTAENCTWKELASCFLSVSQLEEDNMSGCHYVSGDKPETQQQQQQERCSVSYSRIPGFLIRGVSGKSWRLRCKWWMNRYFSRSMLASDIEAGDLQRLVYKAASAAHMYERDAGYVVEAYKYIDKKSSDRELIVFLKEHMRDCIAFYQHFQKADEERT